MRAPFFGVLPQIAASRIGHGSLSGAQKAAAGWCDDQQTTAMMLRLYLCCSCSTGPSVHDGHSSEGNASTWKLGSSRDRGCLLSARR